MIDKKEFLLDSIIKAYIEHLEPIGSGQLKSMYDIAYSPATIRGYFKKLGDEGYLAQEHASSGRTPTTEALKEYWISRLNIRLDIVNYNKINLLAKQIGLTVFLKEQQKEVLNRALNIENLYLLLEFSTFSITIKYNSALGRFLNDMCDLEAFNVLEIAKQIGATELFVELDKYLFNRDFEIINIKEFLKLCVDYDLDEIYISKFLNGNIMDRIDPDIYFQGSDGLNEILPHGYIGIVHEVIINNKKFKMLVVGELSKDYEYFYKGII
ncbi:MAG: heat-inducible transcriptional repressor [Arcobacteraceae bacterium]|jgi:heat-inducible transcriptional repressor